MTAFVIATGNAHKFSEIAHILAPFAMDLQPQSNFSVPEAIEDGMSFIENSLIKARHASQYCDLPAIADDSGIMVDALGGAPGIYSARYAGVGIEDAAHIEKMLKALDGVPVEQRTAQFVCCAVAVKSADDPLPIIAVRRWSGHILMQAQGQGGFGYDPIFYANHPGACVATLSSESKSQFSHRSQAFTALAEQLQEGGSI